MKQTDFHARPSMEVSKALGEKPTELSKDAGTPAAVAAKMKASRFDSFIK